MRRYDTVKQVIEEQRQCVHRACDICKRIAEFPNALHTTLAFTVDLNTDYLSGGSLKVGSLIDGEYDETELDLCPDCAEKLVSLVLDKRESLFDEESK